MDDDEILHRIQTLVDEEHGLRTGADPVDPDRLERLEETLDQCWDLLRQRRARREFHEDEDQAQVRGADIVEGYKQ